MTQPQHKLLTAAYHSLILISEGDDEKVLAPIRLRKVSGWSAMRVYKSQRKMTRIFKIHLSDSPFV